jgi:hypothetical protein
LTHAVLFGDNHQRLPPIVERLQPAALNGVVDSIAAVHVHHPLINRAVGHIFLGRALREQAMACD